MSTNETIEKSITEQIVDEFILLLSAQEEFSSDILEKLKQIGQSGQFTQTNLVKAAIKAQENQDEIART